MESANAEKCRLSLIEARKASKAVELSRFGVGNQSQGGPRLSSTRAFRPASRPWRAKSLRNAKVPNVVSHDEIASRNEGEFEHEFVVRVRSLRAQSKANGMMTRGYGPARNWLR
jgi:hypothetical protein